MAIALPTAIIQLIEEGLLRKDIKVSLRPTQMFRGLVATREQWEARVGESQTFTRNGLLPINTRKRTPGVDPAAQNKASLEQWTVTCHPYNDSLTTFLPDSFVQIQNDVLRDARSLMIQAGTTLNHIVRNKMYNTYVGGNTQFEATAGSAATHRVLNLAGFRETIGADLRLGPVSPSNPIDVRVGAGGSANQVIAVTPDDLGNPDGPGTVTLAAPVAVTAGDPLLAVKRSVIHRVGGAASVDGITTANKLTLAAIREEVARMRTRNVPTFPGGHYHMQLDPTSEVQLLADSELKGYLTGVPESQPFREAAIGQAMGVVFYRNNEVPNRYNTSIDDYVAAPMVNASGVEIHRPILYGQDVMMEKYVPLDKVRAEAADVAGVAKITDWNISQDQSVADLNMEGIKLILRGPMDKLQENIDQTWSFKGDWACPTDSLVGDPALYKRAAVFEHAG